MGVAVLPERWLIHGSGTSETRQTLQCLFQHSDDDDDNDDDNDDDDNDDVRWYAGKRNGTIQDRTQSSIRLAQGPPSQFKTLTAGWANDDNGNDFHDFNENGDDDTSCYDNHFSIVDSPLKVICRWEKSKYCWQRPINPGNFVLSQMQTQGRQGNKSRLGRNWSGQVMVSRVVAAAGRGFVQS